jgi:prophage antirepressor-like protein
VDRDSVPEVFVGVTGSADGQRYLNSAQVRVVVIDDEPWFVTRNLCAILNIANSRRALPGLSESEKGAHTVNTLGGPQKLNICKESGLYVLIFNGRKPQARELRKWVTSEVLPSLRKRRARRARANVSCEARGRQKQIAVMGRRGVIAI